MAYEILVDALERASSACNKFVERDAPIGLSASLFHNKLENIRDVLTEVMRLLIAGLRLCPPTVSETCVQLASITNDTVQILSELVSQPPGDVYSRFLNFLSDSELIELRAGLTEIAAGYEEVRKHLKTFEKPKPLAVPDSYRHDPIRQQYVDNIIRSVREGRRPSRSDINGLRFYSLQRNIALEIEGYSGEMHATLVKVYFATDRRRRFGKRREVAAFRNGRGYGQLTYGEAEVSIPPGHQLGWLERPAIFEFYWPDDDREKYFVVSASNVRSLDQWRESVNARQQFLGTKEVLVFIHGYNVAFDDALMRTAQITKDLQYDGIPVCFSWGSEAKLRGYAADMDNADASADTLAKFLRQLKEDFPDSGVHIIAHSMGNRVLFKALQGLTEAEASQIQEVVMAAPDIDAGHFETALVVLRKRAQRFTLYTSEADLALALSSFVRVSYTRLGQGGENIFVAEGVDTIDGSEAVTALLSVALNHADLFEKERLLSDLHYVIRNRTPVGRRYGLMKMPKGDLHFWRLRPARRS